jgi:flagellar P-ring protein precursor FlgI
MKKRFLIFILLGLIGIINAQTRLKDISKINGADQVILIGYGLVTGLQGTGDSPASAATIQSINNMLGNFGLSVPDTRIRPMNTAAVMVTATMPPFASKGSLFDVRVSSVSDARSLEGGELLMTPLRCADDDKTIYAIAQGQISMGGYVEQAREVRIRQHYSNSGRVPNGAEVKHSNLGTIINEGLLQLSLYSADFTTASRVADRINNFLGLRLATAINGSSISIIVPDNVLTGDNLINFISQIENLDVIPEQSARIVINERTGTIVAGGNVQIAQVAIAHGNLVIRIGGETVEYTTGPFTLIVPETSNEGSSVESQRFFLMKTATVQELAQALNAIKVTPRDMIAIFQSIKEAGALLAELKIL